MVSTNTAGGGARSNRKMYLTRTTISGNVAVGEDGGLYNEAFGAQLLRITDSTIDNNFSG